MPPSATFLASAGEFPAVPMPFFLERVSAGFPSPAQDYVDRPLDLNELCIQRPAATFFVRAQGESMIEAGIFPDDVLVVDRSLTARSGDVVIAQFYGELTVKQLQLGPPPRLVPCNQRLRPIHVPPDADLEILGVVTHVIHSLRK
ncbi:MAG: translesion error-prone DNA polymerase V autoproteolytic subunit [Marinospirillum sp.]|uniref:translesion error-prone DNA polymerase V autoproteolytic subunit n=1 Tax=Marinospirillum sp. TaxID=2183934 RepID=UPI001A094AFD|nr:translesion error-prone DNA polymerase V autoproteolytic subunit [Marinospirillum sp.]MBE0508966.1 translesion error-prone DNA polymerase V autoproteolytic subunit [Marinospirillum sp.]